MSIPNNPKIYHILHLDRIPSIIKDNYLWCDEKVIQGPTMEDSLIGMIGIKRRRLKERELKSHPNLYVGQCVPFYFCPRSIMLYIIHKNNRLGLNYHGGQEPIIHLEADLKKTIIWAKKNQKRWVFTLQNAAANYAEDFCDFSKLNQINWNAVKTNNWGEDNSLKEGKQAEFLIEYCFPWLLVERVGVYSKNIYNEVKKFIDPNKLRIEIRPDWYY